MTLFTGGVFTRRLLPAGIILVGVLMSGGSPAAAAVNIKSMSIHAQISGQVARTTIDIVFANYDARDQEAAYQFRISPEAAVCDLAMWIKGQRSPAEILPRVTAERIYHEIVDQRRDPALLLPMGDGCWSLQVFPVAAMSTQKVQIVYVSMLKARNGQLIYEAPQTLDGTSADTAMDFDFRAELPEGDKGVQCAVEGLSIQRRTGGGATVSLHKEKFGLKEKVAFSFTPATPPAEALLAEKDNQKFFIAQLPALEFLAAEVAQDFVIIVDTSASMGGGRFQVATAASLRVLENLRPGDRFTVIQAASDVTLWKDQLVPASKDNIAKAVEFLGDLKQGGGTDLAAALKAADTLARKSPRKVNVFMLSDEKDVVGSLPLAQELPNPVKGVKLVELTPATKPADQKAPSPARDMPPANLRLFTVTLGGGQSPTTELCHATDGLQEYVASLGAAMEEITAAFDILRKMDRTAAGLKVTLEAADWDAAVLATVVREDGILVSGSVKRAGKEAMRLTISSGEDKTRVQSYTLKPAAADAKGDQAQWLRLVLAHIQSLAMWQKMQRADVGLSELEALVKLSEDNRILTPATAFLVLETDEDYARRGIKHEPAKAPAPAATTATATTTATTAATTATATSAPDAAAKAAEAAEAKRQAEAMRANVQDLLRHADYEHAAALLEAAVAKDPTAFDAQRTAALLRQLVALRQAMSTDSSQEDATAYLSDDAKWYQLAQVRGPIQVLHVASVSPAAQAPAITPAAATKGSMTSLIPKEMKTPIAKVDFQKIPVKEVFDYLRDSCGLKIHVNWNALAAGGIDQTTEVTLVAKDTTPEFILRRVLKDLGQTISLGYTCQEGHQVVVSSKDDLARTAVVRVFDVRDMLAGLPDGSFHGPSDYGDSNFRDSWSGSSSSNESESWGGTPDFGSLGHPVSEGFLSKTGKAGPHLEGPDAAWSGPAALGLRQNLYDLTSKLKDLKIRNDFSQILHNSGAMTRSDALNSLAATITGMVDRDTWAPMGTVGRIRQFREMLVIEQTAENMLQVETLLDDLRATLNGGKIGMPADGVQMAAAYPEGMFTLDLQVTPWVLDLLKKAADGKLSAYSSVEVKKAGGRTFARIGGIWLDVKLTAEARIAMVAPATGAAAEVFKADGRLKECFELGVYVVVALNDKQALCLDARGISKADDKTLKPIVEAAAEK